MSAEWPRNARFHGAFIILPRPYEGRTSPVRVLSVVAWLARTHIGYMAGHRGTTTFTRVGLIVEAASSFDEEDQTALGVAAGPLAVAFRGGGFAGQARELAAVEARQRLARDLHDSVVQLLFSATLVAQSVGDTFRRDVQEGERQAQRLMDLTRAALVEMRSLITDLRPSEIVPDLAAALRAYAEAICPDGLEIELEADGYTRQTLDREEVLYRIGQEALNNVAKHARARHVRLVIRSGDDGVRLAVADDGVGFPSGAVARSWWSAAGGLGLASMRERAEALGGRLQVASSPGGGTSVEVRLPREGGR